MKLNNINKIVFIKLKIVRLVKLDKVGWEVVFNQENNLMKYQSIEIKDIVLNKLIWINVNRLKRITTLINSIWSLILSI